jgi:hypothetical protein
MRKAVDRILAASLVVAMLAVATPAGAVNYEDGLEDCSYPGLVDLFLVRPMGLTGLAIGTVLFVGSSPWILLAAPNRFGWSANALVAKPAWFTFRRPLGECAPNTGF